MPKFIDLTGRQFPHFYVEKRVENKYTKSGHLRVMWMCVCECGVRFEQDGQAIRKGSIVSCGHIGAEKRKEAANIRNKNNYIDYTGQTKGYLKIIGEADPQIRSNGKHRRVLNAICLLCGKETTVTVDSFRSGKKQSCGCLAKEIIRKRSFVSLVGKTFSELYVESRAEDNYLPNGTPVVMYNCICSCGEKTIVSGNNLRSGNTKSCGHIGASANEYVVKQFLNSKKIVYSYDSGFPDLVSSHGGYPRFDFKIFDKNSLKFIIEIQGLQHYVPRKNSDFGKFQREETDKLKREYCLAHDIPLYEIRYNENVLESLCRILINENMLHVNPVPSSE